MAEKKALPPIPFAPTKNPPFCLVDGETGLVLAATRKPIGARDSQPPAAPESSLPPAEAKPGAMSST
jgi:hypothetical protein